MQAHRYPEMLEMIRIGKLQPQQLIEKTIDLAEAAEALTQMDRFPNRGVVVIDPWR
jgi:alcohol dehydrogenase